jgi:hypothetical protein
MVPSTTYCPAQYAAPTNILLARDLCMVIVPTHLPRHASGRDAFLLPWKLFGFDILISRLFLRVHTFYTASLLAL